MGKKTIGLTEDELKKLYINKNLTVKEIAENFTIGTATVNRLLKKYNIKKSEEQRRLAISKTKQEQHHFSNIEIIDSKYQNRLIYEVQQKEMNV